MVAVNSQKPQKLNRAEVFLIGIGPRKAVCRARLLITRTMEGIGAELLDVDLPESPRRQDYLAKLVATANNCAQHYADGYDVPLCFSPVEV